ncbi:MAG: peptide deformylase [Candidatus Peribacteraceae bacterium]|nr:peptide deformylase [Candidatus Peribacteraceae bacterium]
MAVLQIITGANTPVLRKKTEIIPKVTKEIKKLIKDMKETVPAEKGAGLAAPQVGVSLRLSICMLDGKYEAIINPKILWKSEETTIDEEGCLSLPNIWLNIKRHNEIILNYLDEKGKTHEKKYSGFDARVIQHEVDHLDGVLIVDY